MNKLGKAFEEFYRLGNSGNWCCVDMHFDYNYVVYVNLTPSYLAYEDENREHEPVISMQNHEDLSPKGMTEFLQEVVKKAKEWEKKNIK